MMVLALGGSPNILGGILPTLSTVNSLFRLFCVRLALSALFRGSELEVR